MTFSIRSTLLVLTALSASGVAPAQVAPGSEPLLASESKELPSLIVPAILPQAAEPAIAVLPVDPLSPNVPAAEDETVEVTATGDLQSMVSQLRSSDPGNAEMECLAGAIYFESKSESLKGQLAVGHVIANRTKSGRFPSSYCGVVYQRSQFSFVRGRSMPNINRSSMQWKNAVAVAKIVDQELQPAPMPKALFFHAKRVSPGWRLARVGTLGNHVFYR
ncbi:cell wall hydrolase [Sphingomonas rhizophila]|uniref:Cell wall hydrolase n=1 Tax=Sphingomonas rhizophila TaxID=2071607 RepID=A0A7G9SAK5_9SPHN|nr:cell wall hydrolase [Sphingomonas rhizophila]